MSLPRPSIPFRLPVAPAGAPPDARAIAGARAAPLTPQQRQKLAACARRAYDAQAGLGLVEGLPFDAWRHAQCAAALGCAGLRTLDQGRYGRAMAHFVELAGGTPRRRDWRAAGKAPARDDADRARYALRAECAAQAEAFGGAAQAEAYTTALLARIHKTDWPSATARQLWQTLFTLRNRAHAKTHKTAPSRRSGAGGATNPSEARYRLRGYPRSK